MHILSIIFFCIASSSDNFIIGLSYGAKKINISLINNFIVASISCIGTFIAMLFGKFLYGIVSPRHANWIGSVLLILFGLYMLINSLRTLRTEYNVKTKSEKPKGGYYNNIMENPELIDTDHSKSIEFREAVVLGSILCLNNVGLGIGASITGLNMYLTSLASLVFSIVFIKTGSSIGRKVLTNKLSSYSEYISAGIIILLGIYELFF